MSKFLLELYKWRAAIEVSITKLLAYKLNFILQVVGPVVVFYLIQYSLWTSIYELQNTEIIQGYSQSDMLRYQAWVLIVTLLSKGFNSRNLAEDIRLGRISSYLIYPFDFWQYHLANFFGQQIIQVAIAIFTITSLSIFGILSQVSPSQLISGIFLSLLASIVWYQAMYLIGLLAFWLEETWTLRVILTIIVTFCSGAIIPLELFPEWAQTASFYSPFPYLTYVPVKTFLGSTPELPISPLIALVFWWGVAWALCQIVWSKGMKMYSAAGM